MQARLGAQAALHSFHLALGSVLKRVDLVIDLCGGEASELVVAGAPPEWRRQVAFRPARVHALIGLDVPEDESLAILERLGFTPHRGNAPIMVDVPSWRRDIDYRPRPFQATPESAEIRVSFSPVRPGEPGGDVIVFVEDTEPSELSAR